MNASIRGTLKNRLFCGAPLPIEVGAAIAGHVHEATDDRVKPITNISAET